MAVVSGVVLYSPFMRKLDFGTVRREKRPRLKWLDLHNLLGIVTLVWVFVVGATGMINTWADLVIKYWQYDQLSALLAPYKNEPVVAVSERASVQRSISRAKPEVSESDRNRSLMVNAIHPPSETKLKAARNASGGMSP